MAGDSPLVVTADAVTEFAAGRVTLAIETSGGAGSVAGLFKDGGAGRVVMRKLDRAGRRHARTLIPELAEILRERQFTPSDVTAVGVSVGPGSFTGLRVGVAAAKTFAWATGAPLFAVPTHTVTRGQAVRAGVVAEESDLAVVSNAERGQFFLTVFRGATAEPLAVVDPSRLLEFTDGIPVVGSVPDRLKGELAAANWLPEECGTPEAETVARIAAGWRADGRIPDDPYRILPVYGRLSAAEERRAENTGAR